MMRQPINNNFFILLIRLIANNTPTPYVMKITVLRWRTEIFSSFHHSYNSFFILSFFFSRLFTTTRRNKLRFYNCISASYIWILMKGSSHYYWIINIIEIPSCCWELKLMGIPWYLLNVSSLNSWSNEI